MTNGGFQSSWGKAYKYFPLKATFLASVLVFELGSLVCAAAPNSTALIAGRALNGLGASGIGTGAYTIIAFVTAPRRRPMFTGFVGLSFGIACVVGPLIGGVFADRLTWRWCFWINLPVGGLAALIILFFFQAPEGAKPVPATWRETLLQMDPVGVALVMGAIVAYMLALQWGGQSKAWNSSEIIGLLVGFVMIGIVFVIWEYFQGERAMVVPRLFDLKKRAVGISCLFVFFFCGAYYLVIYFLPLYFQSVSGVSAITSGVDTLPLIVSVSTAMIASGIIISHTGYALAIMVGGAAVAIVGAGLLYTLDIGTETGKWVGYQIVAGVGWGLAFQVPIIIGQSSADPKDMSSITAMILCTYEADWRSRIPRWARFEVANCATFSPSLPMPRWHRIHLRRAMRLCEQDHHNDTRNCSRRRRGGRGCDRCHTTTGCVSR